MCDVLVLEDEDVLRMLMVSVLEDHGLTVREAATAIQAVAISRGTPGFSLLVTDIDLGVAGEDGFAVAAGLREVSPDLPVVFVTGRSWLFDGRSSTMRERQLSKPFSLLELVSAVQALLPAAA